MALTRKYFYDAQLPLKETPASNGVMALDLKRFFYKIGWGWIWFYLYFEMVLYARYKLDLGLEWEERRNYTRVAVKAFVLKEKLEQWKKDARDARGEED